MHHFEFLESSHPSERASKEALMISRLETVRSVLTDEDGLSPEEKRQRVEHMIEEIRMVKDGRIKKEIRDLTYPNWTDDELETLAQTLEREITSSASSNVA